MTCREAALQYLGRGFSVIPVRKDKTPLVPWKDFTTRKATEEEVNKWYDQWPDAQVAIVTGAISGVVVLDADKKDALKGVSILPTPIAKAYRGPHYYLKCPDFPVSNKVGILDGVDFKGDGGYIVAPPSVNEQGHQYEWMIDLDGETLAEVPDWCLVELKRPRKEPNEGITEEEPISLIPDGMRNQTLTSLAGTLRRRGFAHGEIEILLKEVNSRRCNPPLPLNEVVTIAASVSRYKPEMYIHNEENDTKQEKEEDPRRKNNSKKSNGKSEEDESKGIFRTFDMVEDLGLVFAVRSNGKAAGFLTPSGQVVDNIRSNGTLIRPPYGEEVKKGLIHYLEDLETYPSVDALLSELKDYFTTYFEAAEPEHYDLMAFFAITAWFTPVLPAVPILAFESGSSKGKTRGAELVWSVCPYPYRSSGTKFASWIRTVDKYHVSTLFINEADMNQSEESQELAKFYNIRPLRAEAVIQRMSEGGKDTKSYFVFGPTVITLRQPIQDDAVERRMIKIHPQSLTRKDIPYNLPKEAEKAASRMRSKLAMMASIMVPQYQHKNFTPGDFEGRRIEPRLVQLCEGTINIATILGKEQYLLTLLEKLTQEQKEGFSYSRDALILRGYFSCVAQDPEILRKGVKPRIIAEKIDQELGVRMKDSTIGRRAPSLGFVRIGRELLLPEKLVKIRCREYLPLDEYEQARKLINIELFEEQAIPF